MSKRTYAGPIIERATEWRIVFGGNDVGRSPLYNLAVDSGSGELVIVFQDLSGAYFVSMYQPMGYVGASLHYANVPFSVTDNLSETEA